MSQFHSAILAILHAGLPQQGMTKKELTAAKRKIVEANGDKAAIDAAAKLVEAGIAAEYLCEPGKLVPVDTLAKVADLVEDGADVTKLQQFSPSQILVGLNEAQLASLKPVEETVETEAPVVEVKPAPEAIVAKAEPAKQVEMVKCSTSLKMFPITELVVPGDDLIRQKLGLPQGTVLTAGQIKTEARHHAFVSKNQRHNFFWLDASLAHNANDCERAGKKEEKAAQEEAELEAYFAFCRELQVGEIKPWHDKGRQRCVACKKVRLADEMRYPPLEVMEGNTFLYLKAVDADGKVVMKDGKPVYEQKLDRNGNPINIIPKPEAAMKRFATCVQCQKSKSDISQNEWLDKDTMTLVLDQAIADREAARAANKAKWERLNSQRNGNRQGGFSMDSKDDPEGRAAFDAMRSQGRRDKRSRGDQNRHRDEDVGSHVEYIDEAAEG